MAVLGRKSRSLASSPPVLTVTLFRSRRVLSGWRDDLGPRSKFRASNDSSSDLSPLVFPECAALNARAKTMFGLDSPNAVSGGCSACSRSLDSSHVITYTCPSIRVWDWHAIVDPNIVQTEILSFFRFSTFCCCLNSAGPRTSTNSALRRLGYVRKKWNQLPSPRHIFWRRPLADPFIFILRVTLRRSRAGSAYGLSACRRYSTLRNGGLSFRRKASADATDMTRRSNSAQE